MNFTLRLRPMALLLILSNIYMSIRAVTTLTDCTTSEECYQCITYDNCQWCAGNCQAKPTGPTGDDNTVDSCTAGWADFDSSKDEFYEKTAYCEKQNGTQHASCGTSLDTITSTLKTFYIPENATLPDDYLCHRTLLFKLSANITLEWKSVNRFDEQTGITENSGGSVNFKEITSSKGSYNLSNATQIDLYVLSTDSDGLAKNSIEFQISYVPYLLNVTNSTINGTSSDDDDDPPYDKYAIAVIVPMWVLLVLCFVGYFCFSKSAKKAKDSNNPEAEVEKKE